MQIVANAGGLNPAGLAEKAPGGRVRARTDRVGRARGGRRRRSTGPTSWACGGSPLTANAYLGAFGIAAALTAWRRRRRHRPGHRRLGGRRTGGRALRLDPDVVRRAGRRRGRRARDRVRDPGDGRQLRGFRPRPGDRRSASRSPRSRPTGPSVITKHPGTGGVVSVDTVTAQLVYEIQSTTYLGPDVTDRPRHRRARRRTVPTGCGSRGVRGAPPPDTLKVCVNELGGFRNQPSSC